MATKRQLMEDPNSSWNKAADDEPLFVLRGQDQLAPPLVDTWGSLAWTVGEQTEALDKKTDDAFATAAAMREWPVQKLPD